MITQIFKKIYFSLDKIDYNWLLFKIKNINLSIKKIPLFLDRVDYNWWSFRITDVNLIIKKALSFLGKITNFKHNNIYHILVTKTSI